MNKVYRILADGITTWNHGLDMPITDRELAVKECERLNALPNKCPITGRLREKQVYTIEEVEVMK